MLDKLMIELADKIAKKKAMRIPFEVIVKPTLPNDEKNRERLVIIKSGNPPVIMISREYIELTVDLKGIEQSKLLPPLKYVMERCIDYIPKMQRTLAIIPLADAISLRRDSRNWAKAKLPNNSLRTVLPDKFFEISYTVHVVDVVTGTKISRHGKDIEFLTKSAKWDLSRMIVETEELEELVENKLDVDFASSKELKAGEISITVTDANKIETSFEY